MEGLLSVDAGDLQRLRARHVAQQPTRLQNTQRSDTVSQATPTPPTPPPAAMTGQRRREEVKEQVSEEEKEDTEKEVDNEQQEEGER